MDDKENVKNITKRKYKKKKLWSSIDENCLIDLWEDSIDEIRKNKKNGHIYELMSEIMCNKGMNYTSYEIHMKLQNLTQKYRKEKKAIWSSSSGAQSEWPLYARINQILGCYKVEESIFQDVLSISQSSLDSIASNEVPGPSELNKTDNNIQQQQQQQQQQQTKNIKSTTPLPPKKKKTNYYIQKHLLNEVKKISDIFYKEIDRSKRVDEQIIKIEEKKINLLEKYVNSNNELNKTLIKYLNLKKQ